jgi:hypothetical protein
MCRRCRCLCACSPQGKTWLRQMSLCLNTDMWLILQCSMQSQSLSARRIPTHSAFWAALCAIQGITVASIIYKGNRCWVRESDYRPKYLVYAADVLGSLDSNPLMATRLGSKEKVDILDEFWSIIHAEDIAAVGQLVIQKTAFEGAGSRARVGASGEDARLDSLKRTVPGSPNLDREDNEHVHGRGYYRPAV